MRLDLESIRGTTPTHLRPSLLAEWRIGAVLPALAIRNASTGELWLELAGQRYPARIASGDEHGPAHGERLQVRVLRTHPVLALETLSVEAPEADEAQATAEALRRFLPKQESPALLLANLAWLARGKGATDALPRPVLAAAARLWQALPQAASLTDPDALEQAVQRSGTFFEANLGAQTSRMSDAPVNDLKALLLGLHRALQDAGARGSAARSDIAGHAPLPTQHGPLQALNGAPATLALLDAPAEQLHELSRQTEGALARLTTVQLANSGAEAPPALLIELPIRHDDRASVLRLRIAQDEEAARGERDAQRAWAVEAALDLGAVGALHARVTLRGRRVGVQLRAESAGIVEALSARSHELEAMLREAGLEIDRIVCLHGMPAGEHGLRPARLLDVRA
jgi:hypothetical protein